MANDTSQYFTFEARVNSFQKVTRKRGSTAGGRSAKALNWPHKQISPANLARAGFFFRPSPQSPDNTVCFLCGKGLDGWEAGDDPLLEHLKHAPQCGWAVVAAIEAEVDNYGSEDPHRIDMVEARQATFGGRWPHDGKKGWKCKTKQLVDAGWKYTPTPDSDDMATCTYCQLALDGWEPNDKPFDEHYNRSPTCPFFALIEQYKPTTKSSSRNKSTRTTRLSVQSAASEMTALTDQTTGPEDSGLTSSMLKQQSGTKRPRAKKGATERATKKRVKRDEAIDEESQQAEDEASQSSIPAQRPRGTKRGRKRGSEAVEESVMSSLDRPASKRRTGRTPAGTVDNSSIGDEAEMTDASAPKAEDRKKTQASKGKGAEHSPEPLASPSSASAASLRAPPGSFPDDDEIERQLEEDLARQLSDAEIAQDSDSERSKARVKKASEGVSESSRKLPSPLQAQSSAAYAMFDPNAPEPDEKIIDDELKMLQAEMEVDEPEPVPFVSKTPVKAREDVSMTARSKEEMQSTGSPSRHDEPKRAEEMQLEGQDQDEEEDEEEEDHDITVGSTETVLKKVYRGTGATGKRESKRPSTASFHSIASGDDDELAEAVEATAVEPVVPPEPPKRGRGRPSKASMASRASADGAGIAPVEAAPKRGRGRPSKDSMASRGSTSAAAANESEDRNPPVRRSRGRPSKKSLEAKAEEERKVAAEVPPSQQAAAPQSLPIPTPSTPLKAASLAPSARQPVLSPSQSPQSSDAENRPPMTRPMAPASMRRLVLAPTAGTPRLSPSKRNVLAGLRSTMPWTAANLEAILDTPRRVGKSDNKQKDRDQELDVVEQFLRQGRELTSAERGMTVEEWIYFNAGEAEKKLKHECETLVSRFESEGTRAIRVLEGLQVE